MKVEVEQNLHMVGGQGATSYATNSTVQEKAIHKAKSLVQEGVSKTYCTLKPEKFVVADLGCSSGPNTFLVISEIMDAIDEICCRLSSEPPELMFFLNDLPGNDFNTIFMSLKTYDKKVQEGKRNKNMPYYVAGVPGSFYQRLFPKESVHFMHSSNSLHWLSQVPQGLKGDAGEPVNKGNIYIGDASPPIVLESYLRQFQRDFSTFLKCRSKEIVSGGQMVLTFVGRSNLDRLHGEVNHLWGLLAKALNSLVSEGVLQEEKVDEFNLPFYAPAMEEVMEAVLNDESFEIYRIETFELNWDAYDERLDNVSEDCHESGKNTAKTVRALLEPMLSSHFGEAILDILFSRYATNVEQHLNKQKTKHVLFTIALKKTT